MLEKKYDEETIKMMAVVVSDIAAEREKQGLSQSELAEKAGIKQSALSRIESLGAMPQLDTLCKVLHPLGLRLAVRPKNEKKENDTMLLSKQDVKKLKVDAASCHLSITVSNDGEFHMVTDREDEFTFEKIDDAIVLKQKKRNVLKWLFNWISLDVKITVPAGFLGDVEIENRNGTTSIYSINLGSVNVKNGNGALTMEDFNATDLLLHNGNGKIALRGGGVTNLDAHSSNGRIQMSDVKCEQKIKAKTSNGRIIANNSSAEFFDFKTANGAILIKGGEVDGISLTTSNGKAVAALTGNEEDYSSMDFSTSMGAIYVGSKKTHGRYLVRGSGKKLEAHTSNGSIRFTFADTPCPDDEYREMFAEIEEALSVVIPEDAENDL